MRTPASLPRIQNEPVVRLLAADLVAPENAREGLQAMRAEIEEALTQVQVAQERFVPELPHRAHLLMVNHRLRRAAARAAARVARGGRRGAQRRKLALVAVAVRKR